MRMRKFWYGVIYYSTIFAYSIAHPARVEGRENIPDGPAVICGNHTGLSDPVMACHATTIRHPLQPMSKIEVLGVPVIGAILRAGGVIGVDRDKPDSKSLRESMDCLKEGGKLLIYPEGTRRPVGEESINPKTGAAFFATRCNTPIVPMYIPREKPLFKKITIQIGEPYYPEFEGKKASADDLDRISAEIMARIDAMRIPHERALKS